MKEKIETLDDFMTKFNFTNAKFAERVIRPDGRSATRQAVFNWRNGKVRPYHYMIEPIQKVVNEYLPYFDAKTFFDYDKTETRGRKKKDKKVLTDSK